MPIPQYPRHPLQLTTGTFFLCSNIIFNNKTVALFFWIQLSDVQETRIQLLILKRKQIQLRDIGPGSTTLRAESPSIFLDII